MTDPERRKARIILDDEVVKPDRSFSELKIGDLFQVVEPDGEVAHNGLILKVTAPPVLVEGLWNVPSIKMPDYTIEQSE